MPKTSPFFPRLEPLNEPKIWEHWSGYLSAPRYQYSALFEYYAIRNSVAVFDTSPLFKYRFAGRDATAFLARVLTRNILTCRIGQAQYTIWCNEAGFVVEDGVILRLAANEYFLTAAEPNLRYFSDLIGDADVTIEDISAAYGMLAVQGPHSRTVLAQLTDAVRDLRYFRLARTEVAGVPVILSRTGYTGDLGFELWIPAAEALTVWDALFAAGKGYNILMMGTRALKMARVEAGLLLLDVDFSSARFAWTDAQRETPDELGLGWMLNKLDQDDRAFIGRSAIEAERKEKKSRWRTVGLAVDYHAYEKIHRDAGIMPPKDGVFHEETYSIYGHDSAYFGYATSYLYSSLLKRHIALAKLPPSLAQPGQEVQLEIMVIHKPVKVLARVVDLPFYNPERKTS